QGDYAKAEPLSQRALAIYEKAYGPDHPTVALLLDSLSSLYSTKGDYSRAKSLYERALAIKEKAIGPDHPDVIHTLRNLAVVLMNQGDFGKAERLFQRAITIQEKAFGPDNPKLSLTLSNLAALYQKKGDTSQAEALYQRAIVIGEKTLGPDDLDVAQSLNNLSVIYKDKREYSQAEPVLRRALAIREKTLGPDHPLVASSLTNLAVLYQTKGDFLPAIQCRIQCNEVTERDLLRNLAAGSENQKTLYLKKTDAFTNQTLSLHLQCAPQSLEAKEAALTVLLRRKGRGLDAMASAIETLRKHQTPEVQKLLDDDANLAGQISVLTLRGPGTKKPEEHLAHLKELETQKEKLEAEISTKSAEFKSQITPITLKSVQQQIPSDGILVEFAFYKPYVPLQSEHSRLAVYTLDHKGEVKWADLGETAPIEQAVSAFRKAVARSKTDLAKDVKPAAQALDRLVIKPVRALVGKTRHLLISPDGVLNLIPFAALMDEQGKFLVEQYQLTYLTSGRDLLRLAVKIESQQPPLVIANP
ncbi:MAG TPA: tetratricopeptide repeat protein, partial [Acidobacteriota bacterium]|nr:tetratricopeptide repeat protein [Acidobacteriota bacterium]